MSLIYLYLKFTCQVFSWRMLPFHLSAVLVTIFLVFSGLDWSYLVFVINNIPVYLLLLTDMLGFLVPIFLTLALAFLVWQKKTLVYEIYLKACVYAILLGFSLSTFIKIFTGRTSPPHIGHNETLNLVDNSRAFNFGFMREQILGGWPSSHATVMFALATTLSILLPAHWLIRLGLFSTALFIAIGVTFGYHWFSEFIAGSLLGISIGLVVGRYFLALLKSTRT